MNNLHECALLEVSGNDLIMVRARRFGTVKFIRVVGGDIYKYKSKTDIFVITEHMCMQAVMYLNFHTVVFSGVQITHMPELAPHVRQLVAVGCGLESIRGKNPGFERLDIRNNPAISINFGRHIDTILVDSAVVDTTYRRAFPSLQLTCANRLVKSRALKSIPPTARHLRELVTPRACSLCKSPEVCGTGVAYGFINYDCCYRCAITDGAPLFDCQLIADEIPYTQLVRKSEEFEVSCIYRHDDCSDVIRWVREAIHKACGTSFKCKPIQHLVNMNLLDKRDTELGTGYKINIENCEKYRETLPRVERPERTAHTKRPIRM